jgi:hypothetical protein
MTAGFATDTLTIPDLTRDCLTAADFTTAECAGAGLSTWAGELAAEATAGVMPIAAAMARVVVSAAPIGRRRGGAAGAG